MAIRHLKIVFVAFISLLCLFYAAQNVANLDACYQVFAYVLGAVDHEVYPDSFFPAIQSPALIWLVLVVVVALEFTAGLLAAKGTRPAGIRRVQVQETPCHAYPCVRLNPFTAGISRRISSSSSLTNTNPVMGSRT